MLDALADRRRRADFAALARQLSGDDPDPLLLEIAQHRAAFAGPFDAAALAAAPSAPGPSSPPTPSPPAS